MKVDAWCALCLTRSGEVSTAPVHAPAVTVVEGTAMCEKHAIQAAKAQAGPKFPDPAMEGYFQ